MNFLVYHRAKFVMSYYFLKTFSVFMTCKPKGSFLRRELSSKHISGCRDLTKIASEKQPLSGLINAAPGNTLKELFLNPHFQNLFNLSGQKLHVDIYTSSIFTPIPLQVQTSNETRDIPLHLSVFITTELTYELNSDRNHPNQKLR